MARGSICSKYVSNMTCDLIARLGSLVVVRDSIMSQSPCSQMSSRSPSCLSSELLFILCTCPGRVKETFRLFLLWFWAAQGLIIFLPYKSKTDSLTNVDEACMIKAMQLTMLTLYAHVNVDSQKLDFWNKSIFYRNQLFSFEFFLHSAALFFSWKRFANLPATAPLDHRGQLLDICSNCFKKQVLYNSKWGDDWWRTMQWYKGVGKSLDEGRFFGKDFDLIGKVDGIEGKGPF